MTAFLALLRLQLLSRFADLKPRNMKNLGGKGKGKAGLRIFAYIFLIVYLGGILIFVENSVLNVLISVQMPDLLLGLCVTAAMLSTLVLGFFFILSSLFLGRDASFLASLPIRPRTLLSAKLCQVYLSETGVAALFILPAGILYGIKLGTGAGFYLRLIFVLLGVSVLPICIVTVLSALLIRISVLWKRWEAVATAGGIALMIAYFILCANLGSVLGATEDADLVQNFFLSNHARITAITRMFPPAAWAANGLLGDGWQLLLFLLVCAGAAALVIFVLGFFYQKLSLTVSAAPTPKRKVRINRESRPASPFLACLRREVRQLLRVPAYAMNALPTAIMPVFMIAVFYFSFSGAAAEDPSFSFTALLGELPGGVILAVLAAVMSFMAGVNPAAYTAVTREGKGHDWLTALPVSPRVPVLAKLAVGTGLSLLGLVLAAGLLIFALPDLWSSVLAAFLLSALYSLVICAFSITNDVKNPKLSWVTETEAIKQQSGSLIGLLVSWGLLVLLGIISWLVLSRGLSAPLYFLLLLVLLATAAFFSCRRLLTAADRDYCQG